MFVLRDKSGAYFAGYDGDGCLIGKRRDARRYLTREAAEADKPKRGEWIIEALTA